MNNQLKLDRFTSDKLATVKLTEKERISIRKKKQHEINQHLEKAIIGISELTPYRSFSFSEILLHLNKASIRLEKKQILFNKIYKGKRKLFKKFYCRRGADAWRRCPEPSCVAFANGMDYECPYVEAPASTLWAKAIEKHKLGKN